jgi:F0F1-type ATP synthase alpha subunit
MKYTVEMASCGMIYIPSFMKIATGVQAIPSFIKIGSGIQNLIEGDTDRGQGDLISLLSFFQTKESRIKRRDRTPAKGEQRWPIL